MEIILLSIVSFVALCFIIFKLKTPTHSTNSKLPPGRNGWPFVGESLEYLSLAKNGVFEKFFHDRTRIYSSKVFKTYLFFNQMAVFHGAEGNKFLFSNENKLVESWLSESNRKLFPISEKSTETDALVRLRKIIVPFLKPDSLQKYISKMDSSINEHFQTYWNSEQVKVNYLAKKCSFTLACQLFLKMEDQVEIDELEKPMNYIFAGVYALPINLPGTKFNRAMKASAETRKRIQVMVKQRKIDLLENKVAQAHDILSLMLIETYKDGDSISDEDIANSLFGLLVGSHETISTTLVSVINYLAELPHIYDEVLKEQKEIANSKGEDKALNWQDLRRMKYLRNVISESLRLMPPVSGTFREALTDFTYEGFLIPKGWKIHWNAYATHKDSDYFPNPGKFDPTRFEKLPAPYSYVPFGGGPRMCPGEEYARLLALVFVHNLVKLFRWEKVFPDEKIIVDPIPEPTHGLPVRLHPRKF